MRILAISKCFPPETDAQSIQVGRVIRAIRGTNAEVYVVAGFLTRSIRHTFEKQVNGYATRYIPIKPPYGSSGLFAGVVKRVVNEISTIHSAGRWVTQALAEALRISRFFKPEILFTASTPFDSHLVGLRLKRMVMLPWVASFSDPWPAAVIPPPYRSYSVPLLSTLQLHLLRTVLREADAIHMPSRIAVDMVQAESGVRIDDKSWAIPHIGTQPPLEARMTPNGWLVHIGHLTRERVSRPLLEALQQAALSMPDTFKGFLHVGTVCPEFQTLVKKLGIRDIVRLEGPVPPERAIAIATECTALLVIEANMLFSPFLPSKFADYSMIGRPIIALTPPVSAVRDYLKRHGGGIAVLHKKDQILSAIHQVFQGVVDPRFAAADGAHDLSSLFTSSSIGSQYLEIVENVCSVRNRPSI